MIVCFGTTPVLARTMQFDRLTIDAVNRASDVHEYASGKPLNAARVVATLGETACCIVPRGGLTGTRMAALATMPGVVGRLVEVDSPTRLCVTVIDHAKHTTTELIENGGPLTSIEVDAMLTSLDTALANARFAILTGSLAAGVPADLYARCVKACHAKRVRVLVDAAGPALMACVDERPTVVKLNAEELGKSVGRPTETDEQTTAAANELAERTGGWVIVTRGKASTIASDAGRSTLVVPVPAVKVVSAIGSGDSFAAGLAVGLVRDMPMQAALKLATACASANAMTPHAGHVILEDVEMLMSA